jgi:hypothetical protein
MSLFMLSSWRVAELCEAKSRRREMGRLLSDPGYLTVQAHAEAQKQAYVSSGNISPGGNGEKGKRLTGNRNFVFRYKVLTSVVVNAVCGSPFLASFLYPFPRFPLCSLTALVVSPLLVESLWICKLSPPSLLSVSGVVNRCQVNKSRQASPK